VHATLDCHTPAAVKQMMQEEALPLLLNWYSKFV